MKNAACFCCGATAVTAAVAGAGAGDDDDDDDDDVVVAVVAVAATGAVVGVDAGAGGVAVTCGDEAADAEPVELPDMIRQKRTHPGLSASRMGEKSTGWAGERLGPLPTVVRLS